MSRGEQAKTEQKETSDKRLRVYEEESTRSTVAANRGVGLSSWQDTAELDSAVERVEGTRQGSEKSIERKELGAERIGQKNFSRTGEGQEKQNRGAKDGRREEVRGAKDPEW